MVYYVEIRPDRQTAHDYSIVLHYQSGWQTWIGVSTLDGFQEEYDPTKEDIALHAAVVDKPALTLDTASEPSTRGTLDEHSLSTT